MTIRGRFVWDKWGRVGGCGCGVWGIPYDVGCSGKGNSRIVTQYTSCSLLSALEGRQDDISQSVSWLGL